MRVSLLTNMISPYRVPLFVELKNVLGASNFAVLVCVAKEFDREWAGIVDGDFQVRLMKGFTFNFRLKEGYVRIIHLRLGVVWELIRYKPDRLIIGDASWTAFVAAIVCMAAGIPYTVWSELTTSSKVRGDLMSFARKLLYRNASHFVVSGTLAKKFLLQHNCPPRRIKTVHNAVDNDYYLAQNSHLKPRRDDIRKSLGLGADVFAFIYVGQLIERKQIQKTLEIIAEISKTRSVHMLIAGGGPLENKVRQRAQELQFEAVTFCGFLNADRLSELYVASDALILISKDEPWGMVINESLLFGKPFFASDQVGAAIEFAGWGGVVCELEMISTERVAQFIEQARRLEFSIQGGDECRLPSPRGMALEFMGAL